MTRTQRRIEEFRKGDAVVFVGSSAGVPVWVEQETHAFPFACVPTGPGGLPDVECTRRLAELFTAPDGTHPRFDAPDHLHLGLLRVRLDQLAAGGAAADLYVRGRTVAADGLDERTAAHRIANLYALCFSHPAVRSVVWDGDGLLRADGSPTHTCRLLRKLIDVVWHSRADAVTGADGRFRFRGFYGDYRVGVRDGDETKVFRLSLLPGAAPTLAPIPAAP